MTVRVKICGLTRKSDVERAIKYGADAVGFIFGHIDSPRNLTVEQLKSLISVVPPFVSSVVVSPASNRYLDEITDVKPNYLQLYEDGEDASNEKRYFTKVIQTVRPIGSEDEIVKRAVTLAKNCDAILFDGSNTSRYASKTGNVKTGSVKEQFVLAKKIKGALNGFPFILSGGLTVQNVTEAVQSVLPYAVDVSSGVEESPGIKDEKKIMEFIKTAKTSLNKELEVS